MLILTVLVLFFFLPNPLKLFIIIFNGRKSLKVLGNRKMRLSTGFIHSFSLSLLGVQRKRILYGIMFRFEISVAVNSRKQTDARMTSHITAF